MDDEDVIHSISHWTVLRANVQSRIWQLEHWILTHLFPLTFCHSCSGYFHTLSMVLPDMCEACYARDYDALCEK